MMNFTNDQMNLMCIYNTGNRQGLIKALSALMLKLSAWVFGIISTILGLLGLAVLLLDSVTNGIIILVIAFLVSPIGLPMVAAWTIGQMQRFRYFVQDAVYG